MSSMIDDSLSRFYPCLSVQLSNCPLFSLSIYTCTHLLFP